MACPRSPFPLRYLDEAIGFLVPCSQVSFPVPRPRPAFRSSVPSFLRSLFTDLSQESGQVHVWTQERVGWYMYGHRREWGGYVYGHRREWGGYMYGHRREWGGYMYGHIRESEAGSWVVRKGEKGELICGPFVKYISMKEACLRSFI